MELWIVKLFKSFCWAFTMRLGSLNFCTNFAATPRVDLEEAEQMCSFFWVPSGFFYGAGLGIRKLLVALRAGLERGMDWRGCLPRVFLFAF